MNEEEFAELAAGAALHALSPDDARRYRAALAAHPEWRAIAEADAETADLLADGVAAVPPPPRLRSDLLAQIAATPQGGSPATSGGDAPPADLPAAPAGSRLKTKRGGIRMLFALAASVALLVGIGFGAVALNGYLNRPASVVALEEIRSAPDAEQATVTLEGGGKATAHWSASLGTVVLVADGIPALPKSETYELWFVRGETPVSAGVFTAGDGDAVAVLDGDMQAGDVIAVTVEPDGGSPTGKPTSDPVIVIPTA